MQPKQLAIGAAIAVALIATFFALRQKPADIKTLTPKTIAAIPDLERIEIIPAKQDTPDGKGSQADNGELGGDVPKVITLKHGAQGWRMAEPIDSGLNALFLSRLGQHFQTSIGTDDVTIDPAKAAEYGLSDVYKTHVKLYAKGQDKPAQELFIGKELTIPKTSARRTYIQVPGDERIYRLQASIGFLRQRNANDLRDKIILNLSPKAIKKLTLAHKGQAPIVLERQGQEDQWQHVQTSSPVRIDPQTVNFILGSLDSLALTEFSDTLKPEDVGMNDPIMTLTIEGDEEPIKTPLTLKIAKQVKEPDFISTYYVQRSDKPGIYPISNFNGGHLTPELNRLRYLHPRPIAKDTIRKVSFLDSDDTKKKVVLTFDGKDKWRMIAPVDSEQLDGVQLKALLDAISDLRIGRYANDGEDSGLDNPDAERVEVGLADGSVVALIIGDKLKDDENAYWGKFSDAPMPFVLTKYMIRQFKPALNTLLPPDKLKALGLSPTGQETQAPKQP